MACIQELGLIDGPASPEIWKKAVHRRAPKNFRVEVLHPEKHGSSYSYGFRVYPIKDDDVSTFSRAVSSRESIVSFNAYNVWRKWEDCLWFQDTLEVEYSRAAREKRNRLAAGKGVKKNGVYIHSDEAASWESLPFGPDPNDIARDIHEYIPVLSKKGTIFRASQETIDRRYEELKIMMQTLLQDDLPTLIKEIKATRDFTDFFGVWGRDIDLARKADSSKKQPTSDQPRLSLSASILSISQAPPPSLVKWSSPSKGKAPENAQIPFRTSIHSDSSSEDSVDPPRPSRVTGRTQEIRSMRSRTSSSGSHSSSSSPSTPVTTPLRLPQSCQPAIASQESPIRYGHNPHVLGGDRSPSVLASLPEDRELSSSPKSDLDGVRTRGRPGSASSKTNRHTRLYVPAPSTPLQSPELSSRSRHSTASLQSTHSSTTLGATAYLDELDVDYYLQSPTPEPRRHTRVSVSSLASIVTNSSVDAVIPRSERPSRSSANNAHRPLSLAEESYGGYEPRSEDDSRPEDQGDILDAYFHELIGPDAQIPDGFPETPIVDKTMYRVSQKQSSTTISSYSSSSDRRSSLATSISSRSTSSSLDPTVLSIKAMHEDNIVMLRLPRFTALDELRRNVYDKFMRIDNPTISESFAIAFLQQETGRPRAGSLSSVGSAQAKGAALHFISSQGEWDNVAATSGKIVLRIIGSRE
ncbi:hypothetical protein J3R82DRAFT_11370 [Butyriboletus roseoflavus]|nr:hypothetical protein J3R82DRAFT_11370 [Butyriboletus roseoflavus]